MSLGIESGVGSGWVDVLKEVDPTGAANIIEILFGDDKAKAAKKSQSDPHWADQLIADIEKNAMDEALQDAGIATPDEVLALAKIEAKLAAIGIDAKQIGAKVDGLTDEERKIIFGTKNKGEAKAQAIKHIVRPKAPLVVLGSVAPAANYAWLPWLLGVGALAWWLTSKKGA